jgi:RNA polymerase primary sigma factor
MRLAMSEFDEVEALLERGRADGYVPASAVERVATELDLGEHEVDAVHEHLRGEEIDVRDDAGAEIAPWAPATYTTDGLAQFLGEAARHRLLSAAEEVDLAQRIEGGDLAAKERMIICNVRLVISIARTYRGVSDLALLDLIQEGTLGLIRAVEKFDWRRGRRFSTYGSLWVRQAIGRAVDSRGRAIPLPPNIARRERKVAAAEHELAICLGRVPKPQEIADAAGVRRDELDELRMVARTITSLDRPAGDETDTELGALLPAGGPPLEEQVAVALRDEAVRSVVEQLPGLERDVIRLRFGLNGDPQPVSQREAARRLGLRPSDVRALERRALEDLATRRDLAELAA